MIDELKMILDAIGDLSGVALWVVGGFLIYKLVMYLSTAGAMVYVSKLLIIKLHDVAITRKTKGPRDITSDIRSICISSDGTDERMLDLLRRIKAKNNGNHSSYIHDTGFEWLEAAVNEKEEREAKSAKA